MKSKVDKLDVDRLVPVPADLSKLSGVGNNVVKKDLYSAKIKNIEDKIPDTTNLAANTTLNAKISEIENEMPSITNLTTATSLNANINEIKNEIPDITNLATSTALTRVWNKIPDHSKNIASPESNKLTAENFTARLAQPNL